MSAVQLRTFLALCFVSAVCLAFDEELDEPNRGIYKVFRLLPTNDSQLAFVGKLYESASEYDLDFWQPPKRLGNVVDVMVPPTLVDTFPQIMQQQEIRYQITINDVQQLISEREKKKPEEDFERILRDDADRRSANYDFGDYGTYAQMRAYMQRVERAYPTIARVFSIGRSHEGRTIYGLKIGHPQNEASKPVIWVDGGIHSREWAAPHTAIYFIDTLVKNYQKDGHITYLVNHLNWYIVPLINPDGYEYSRSSRNPSIRMWRKNRSPPECRSGSRKCCQGVDLNRNFDFHWSESGSSRDPCSEVYHGEAAFSEPESKALRDMINSPRLRGKVDAFITLHTFSQIWIHPFGHRRNRYPQDVQELHEVGRKAADALKKVHGTKYYVGSGADTLYPAAGGSDDWAKDKAGIKFVYLIELRPDQWQWDGFILRKEELVPTADETWAGVKVVADEVLEYRNIDPYRPGERTASASERVTEDLSDECFDLRYACKKWVSNNPQLCTTVRYFMREQCRMSCGHC